MFLSRIPETQDHNYLDIWTNGKYNSVRILVTKGPYTIKDSSLKHLKAILNEQAGLSVNIIDGTDTKLPKTSNVETIEVVRAALKQVPQGVDPIVVLVAVNGMPDNINGGIIYGIDIFKQVTKNTKIDLPAECLNIDRFLAIVVINTNRWEVRKFEEVVLLHEIGHWLGVPAKKFHIDSDGEHCTCEKCVMLSVKIENILPVLINSIFTGIPKRFCPYCAQELDEMRRLREANSKQLM